MSGSENFPQVTSGNETEFTYEPTFQEDFERDGVTYSFYIHERNQHYHNSSFNQERNQWMKNYVENIMALYTQAVRAKIAFIFEDKVPIVYTAEPIVIPGRFALYIRKDDPEAATLLRRMCNIYKGLSKSRIPSWIFSYMDEDSFKLTPDQARDILVQAAEETGYELPEES